MLLPAGAFREQRGAMPGAELCCTDLPVVGAGAPCGSLTSICPRCLKEKPSAKALFVRSRNLIFLKEDLFFLTVLFAYFVKKEFTQPTAHLTGMPDNWCPKEGTVWKAETQHFSCLTFLLEAAEGSGVFGFLGLWF